MASSARRLRSWVEAYPGSRQAWFTETAPDRATVGVASKGDIKFHKEFEAANIDAAAELALSFLDRVGEDLSDLDEG